jgi:ribonuclease HI
MHTLDELLDASFHAERVLSRRMAARDELDLRSALEATLLDAAAAAGFAGSSSLDELLDSRRALRTADASRLAGKAQRKADKLAHKLASGRPAQGAWLAWFDGSARPNPGRLGIGALLTGPDGQRVEISEHAGHGNSSEAEYAALIALLEAATALQPPELVVHGDSRVVIDDVLGREAESAKSLAVQRARAVSLIAQLRRVELKWVPRHKNASADRLSQLASAASAGAEDAPQANLE